MRWKKEMILKQVFFSILTSAVCSGIFSFNQASAQSFSAEDIRKSTVGAIAEKVTRFYRKNGFNYEWLHSSQSQVLEDMIKRAADYGLEPSRYAVKELRGRRHEDSVASEISYAGAALQLIQHLHSGKTHPEFRFEGIEYHPDTIDFSEPLLEALRGDRLSQLIQKVQPKSADYENALQLFQHFVRVFSEPGFSDVRIISAKNDYLNKNLRERLIQLYLWDEKMSLNDTSYARECIRKAQRQFGFAVNGKISSGLVRALNLPLHQRMEELSATIDFLRWSQEMAKKETVIFLNIPSADLRVIKKGSQLLASRVVAGKTSTPTPTLTSRIEELILYPYWLVPYKIATRELLPQIRRDISFLDRNAYQVLNQNGRVMNPHAVPWQSLSRSYFPYTLRQSSGCDNSLGLVKFDFENPFSVYLHDSPARNLFGRRKRYYSHGCMRVEKALELAHILLGQNRIAVDTLTAKGCLLNQSHIPVRAEIQPVLIVSYQTCWFDESANVIFYEDIYRKIKR